MYIFTSVDLVFWKQEVLLKKLKKMRTKMANTPVACSNCKNHFSTKTNDDMEAAGNKNHHFYSNVALVLLKSGYNVCSSWKNIN